MSQPDPDETFVGSFQVRTYIEGVLVRSVAHEIATDEQFTQVAEADMEALRKALELWVDEPRWLLEFELLGSDDPDRFMRFGTDTDGMIDPILVPKPKEDS